MQASPAAPDFDSVHGAFGDASVWTKIAPPFLAAGAKTTAFDRPPAHSDADEATAGKTTLDDSIANTRAVVEAQPEPVILVGTAWPAW